MYSGVKRGRVLSGELYTQRLQKLIYLYLSTDCCVFHEDFSRNLEEWREIFMKQSVDKYKWIRERPLFVAGGVVVK